jgi:DNA gyrase subunit A
VAGAVFVLPGDKLMVITNNGRAIKCAADDIRKVGRSSKGVRIMKIEENERLVSVARMVEAEAEEEEAVSPIEPEEVAAEAEASEADGEE